MLEKKRLKFFGFCLFTIFISLSIRLYYIQVVQSSTYSELALKQRSSEIQLYPNRGIVYDKNLMPLTNTETTKVLIISKDIIINDNEIYKLICNKTKLSSNQLKEIIDTGNNLLQVPIIEKFDVGKYNNRVFFTDRVKRYGEENILSHVIGYVNKSDNKGETGIEKVYDEFLKDNEEKYLVLEYDSSRSIILNGVEYVNELDDPNNPTGVKLTIDLKIQKAVENIMDINRINGAVVITEVDSGKILSLASRPNFNQDKIGEYFDNNKMALYNKAIQVGYPPGSIFKIVVLIAALESNIDITEEVFLCPGHEDVNNLRIKCTGKHGYINLEEAFALSCNSTFIKIGKEIGSKKIIEVAKRLNFGEKIGIGLLEETKGNLPNGDDLLGPAIGNISIGQGKIEATPLQISNLLMIIANNGIQKHLTIVDGITNSDGLILKYYNKEQNKEVISASVSKIAYEYLLNVVENGTGKNIDLDSIGGAGGKTGSAEAILYNNKTIHGWFSGFHPKANPKYVITVFVEEGYSGSKSAAPIFEQIVKEINSIYPLY